MSDIDDEEEMRQSTWRRQNKIQVPKESIEEILDSVPSIDDHDPDKGPWLDSTSIVVNPNIIRGYN